VWNLKPEWWGSLLAQVEEFIHLVVCLKTGTKPLPNPSLHIARSRASYFRCEYPLHFLRLSSSFLRLLPRFPITSILPFIFPSITCHRRQFLHKIWPIQLAFHLLISCTIFLCSLTLSKTFSFLTWSVQLISILLQHHISELCSGEVPRRKRLWQQHHHHHHHQQHQQWQ
jgi:hypothetical protein